MAKPIQYCKVKKIIIITKKKKRKIRRKKIFSIFKVLPPEGIRKYWLHLRTPEIKV